MSKEHLYNLYKKIWITRGCRFQAHKRLNASDNWSTWTVNILTVYIISISILSLEPPRSFEFLEQKVSSIFLICISILILVISILEASKNYKLKADIMHRCGKELSSIYNEVNLIKDGIVDATVNDRLIDLTLKYQQILDKYDDNHIEMDYEMFKVDNFKDFNLRHIDTLGLRTKYFIRTKGFYLILIVVPLIVFIFLALTH